MNRLRTGFKIPALLAGLMLIEQPAFQVEAEDAYRGPTVLHFESSGTLSPSRSGLVDLTSGTADVSGPCGTLRRCSAAVARHLTLSPSNLASFRALATKIATDGLYDAACLRRQHEENDKTKRRLQNQEKEREIEWRKSHPNDGPGPISIPMPPLDPFFASFTIQGVGNVVSTPEIDGEKADVRCATPEVNALWNLVQTL
jgi:hypothetical protein